MISWPKLPELSALSPFSGAREMRRGSLLSIDRGELATRMRRYFDKGLTIQELQNCCTGPVQNMARFSAAAGRDRLLREEPYSERAIRQIALYPFDTRWAYHTNVRPIWNEPRPELVARVFPGNGFLVTRVRARRPGEGVPVFWTTVLAGYHLLDPNSHPLPLLADEITANLSLAAVKWLRDLGMPDASNGEIAKLPWLHALAVSYSPVWLAENAESIRQDWPRVPLPDNAALVRSSAELGSRVAALLDPETPVLGVTTGALNPALSAIAIPTKQHATTMREADRMLTAGWGHAGKDGAVMPGRGRILSRDYAPDESASKKHASLLGTSTNDIYLNADAYWRNIPKEVWGFAIGGYQVLKKWLSYREQPILGRALTPGEVRYVRDLARRLAALRLMGPELDANFRACTAAHRSLILDSLT
jgi:Type ISP C-terminal specificity domain